MKRRTAPVLIIGHDLLALGLAASLRSLGQWVLVRDASQAERESLLTGPAPSAIIVDLLIASRNDFALLRTLRQQAHLLGVPTLVLSPGTVGHDRSTLESQLCALGAQPLLTPHDLDEVINELDRSLASVA